MHDPDPFRRAGASLQLIFWGTILVLLDFNFTFREGATGFSCDILHDLIGYAMIAMGLSGLRPLGSALLNACFWIAVISVPASIHDSICWNQGLAGTRL